MALVRRRVAAITLADGAGEVVIEIGIDDAAGEDDATILSISYSNSTPLDASVSLTRPDGTDLGSRTIAAGASNTINIPANRRFPRSLTLAVNLSLAA